MASYRIGQVVTLILFLAITGGFVASIFFSWTLEQWVFQIPSGCNVNKFTSWKQITYQCTTQCLTCPSDVSDWTLNCTSSADPFTGGPSHCMRQFYIWQSTFGLNIVVACLFGITTLMYIVHMIGVLKSGTSLGFGLFSIILSIAVCAMFAASLPFVIQADANEKNGQPLNTACPNSGPCTSFIGTAQNQVFLSFTNGAYNWGPSAGWIIYTATMCFGAIALFIIYFIGRGGDKWLPANPWLYRYTLNGGEKRHHLSHHAA